MQSVRAIQSSDHSYSIATAVVVYLLEPSFQKLIIWPVRLGLFLRKK